MLDEIVNIGTEDNKEYLLDMRKLVVPEGYKISGPHEKVDRFLVELGDKPGIYEYQGGLSSKHTRLLPTDLPVIEGLIAYSEIGPLRCGGYPPELNRNKIIEVTVLEGNDRDEAIEKLDKIYKELILWKPKQK